MSPPLSGVFIASPAYPVCRRGPFGRGAHLTGRRRPSRSPCARAVPTPQPIRAAETVASTRTRRHQRTAPPAERLAVKAQFAANARPIRGAYEFEKQFTGL